MGKGGLKRLQESNALVQVFGRFDVHVARYVMDKQESTQTVVFKSLLEICKSFVLEIQKVPNVTASDAWEGFGKKTLKGVDIDEGELGEVLKKLQITRPCTPRARRAATTPRPHCHWPRSMLKGT